MESLSGVYVYSRLEERSLHFDPANSTGSSLEFIRIHENQENETISVDQDDQIFSIHNIGSYNGLIERCRGKQIFLDITGMTHSVWAPFMKRCLEEKIDISVVYVEPDKYKKSSTPTGGEIYDLSERVSGIRPIPGLSSFPSEDDIFIFIPVLGFEGPRFSFMVENIQPLGSKTFPIVGVPGFRAEYPFFTYYGNRIPLRETKSWKNIVYAQASCPYSVFFELMNISQNYPDTHLKIGLMGTKPHALGSILFRLMYPQMTEIIYDHPIRKPERTIGAYTKYIFDVSAFFNSRPSSVELLRSGRLR